MQKNYVIGFPRIGEKRELKKVLENYWSKQIDFNEVKFVAENLKKKHTNIKNVTQIFFGKHENSKKNYPAKKQKMPIFCLLKQEEHCT